MEPGKDLADGLIVELFCHAVGMRKLPTGGKAATGKRRKFRVACTVRAV
jgi:hypothetical protein